MRKNAKGSDLKRIGILGGTFDPIHSGHIAVARVAVAALGLEQLYIIPNRAPPHKPAPHASDTQRMQMVQLACVPYPQWAVSDSELRRSGPSYTIDTLKEFATLDCQLVLILGADAAALLPLWYHANQLGTYCTVAVIHRSGSVFDDQQIRQQLPNLVITQIAWAGMDVSSSTIRQRCANGVSITDLVPASVADYIHQHHLYGAPRD